MRDTLELAARVAAPLAAGDSGLGNALIGMASALGVALIGLLGAVVVARRNSAGTPEPPPTPPAPKIVAYERFLLLRDFDPRRIRTGYETDERARHVPPTP